MRKTNKMDIKKAPVLHVQRLVIKSRHSHQITRYRKRANPDDRDNSQNGHQKQQSDFCADNFYKKTKERPIYCCISCKRALFRHSGLAFNTKRYSTNIHNVVFELLDRNDKKQTTLSTNGFVLHVIGH